MNTRLIVLASGIVFTGVLQICVIGCSGGSSAAQQPSATKEQQLALINKVPMPPDQRAKLTQQIESGKIKGKS